jgi:hypothetical protein
VRTKLRHFAAWTSWQIGMSIDLRYGCRGSLPLELPPGVAVRRCGAPHGVPLREVGGAVAAALAEPLGYPPLIQSIVPDDRVVIALAGGVPQGEAIVSQVVRSVIEGGSSPADVTLLVADTVVRGQEDRLNSLAADWPDVRRLVHDPADRREMAFLARTSDQMQVMLNRALVDADVVVSVGCLHPSRTIGYDGAAGCLCPAFSDQPTQRRFRAFHATETPRQHAQRAREKAAEIAWLLGARFTVQAIPGLLDAVASAGQRRCDEAWELHDLSPASLVVVAVEGGPEHQTWDSICRALATAAEVVEPGGAIAICSELDSPPGEALQILAGADNLNEAIHAIRRSPPADALPALQLASTIADHHVYLLSRLPSRDVEELGMVAVSHPDELAHLARSRPSCLLLSGGAHVQARANAECRMRNAE